MANNKITGITIQRNVAPMRAADSTPKPLFL